MKKNKFLFLMIYIVYIAAVVYITILSRQPGERRYSMDLFESYYYLLHDKNHYYYNMIYYNIVMTLPFGLMTPMLFKSLQHWHKILIASFIFSLIIESSQYITGRGLFEADDLFNNTIGGLLGYIFFAVIRFFMKVFTHTPRQRQHNMK